MSDLTQDQAVEALRKLPEDKQRLVLGKLTPDARKNILSSLQSAATKDLTTNTVDPKTGTGYGLYRMVPTSQEGYTDTAQEVHVPFNRVQDALDSGKLKLHFDEEPRYKKDFANQGKGPTLVEQAKSGIDSALQPSTGVSGQIPVVPGINVNAAKAAGRVLVGTPGFVKDLAAAYLHGTDEEGKDFLSLVDPFQVPANLQKQFQEDYKTNPKLAVDNLMGSIAGMGLTAAVTHGVTETVPKIAETLAKKPAMEGVRSAIRDTLGVTENTEKVVKKFGKQNEQTREQNAIRDEQTKKQRGAVDESNKTNAETHADALKKHNENIVEIARKHRKDVADQEQAHGDALKKHQDDTKAIQAGNVQALKDHLQVADKIAKDNKAAEDIIKTRQKGEKQIADDTAEFHERIATAEKKAKAADDAAWDKWRKKLGNTQVNMEPVVDLIGDQEARMQPNQVSEFRDILKTTEPSAEDVAAVDKLRAEIVKNSGYTKKFDQLRDFEQADVNAQLAEEMKSQNLTNVIDGKLKEVPAERLHGWKTQLERAVRMAKDGNVITAIGLVLDRVRKLEEEVSTKAGAEKELKAARALHIPFVETFRNSPNEPATVANTFEKRITPDSVKDRAEETWGKQLGHYDPKIPKLAEGIQQAEQGLKQLDTEDNARKMVKPIPMPPVPTPLPTEPVAPEPVPPPQYPVPPVLDDPKEYGEPKKNKPLPTAPNVQAENLKYINDGLRKYGKVGGWVLRLIVGGTTAALTHGSVSEFGGNLLLGQTAVTLLTKALRSESMLNWLSKVSAEDIKTINTLPPADAARMRAAINVLVNEEIKNSPDPTKAKESIAPGIAGWLAGGAAANKQNQKKGPKDLLSQAKDLQSSFYKSGYAPSGSEIAPKPGHTHEWNESTGSIVPVQ